MNLLAKITALLVKGKALIQIVNAVAELIDRIIEPVEDFSKKVTQLKDSNTDEETKQ